MVALMASVYVGLMLLLTCFEIIAAQQHHQYLGSSIIKGGSSLSASKQPSSWNSSSGRFQFGFYKQYGGFAVGIWLVTSSASKIIVWTANRDDPPLSSNATLTLTMDGKLILRTEESEDKAIADASETASFASMLDSGNFVLYNSSSAIIWSSFGSPTDTILGGQWLGYQLFSDASKTDSSTGRFRLYMQPDNNLVLYPTNSRDEEWNAYWESDTYLAYENSAVQLNLSTRGVLQLVSGNKTLHIIANSSVSVKNINQTVIYRATLDPDGILRLYSHRFEINGNSDMTIEWSALQNQCEVKGFCGLNSFCYSSSNSSSTEVNCYCFPGFDFINPEKQFLGCYRNFSDEEDCKRRDPAEFYKITDMENTKLGGYPYAQLSVSKKDCAKSCLNDCYCAAAVYVNGTCSELKLPLMYGVKDHNESATVFIKWSSGNANLHAPRIHKPFPNERVVTDNKKNLITYLAACLSSITFLCFLIAVSSLLVYRLRVNRYQKLRENSDLDLTQAFTLQSFSYNELEQATNGFQEELGRGSFGAVYKGAISEDNKIVAVKRLENPVEEGERKFQAEMNAVRQTHHKNLVRLLGFCMQSSKKLLVYEFMSKGSLENLLFNVERGPIWRERLRIAMDVARGILYLHEECEVQIIHCNINPRNILLNDASTAKISNFGLAKLLMPNQTGIVAGVRGSRGYMAPEWQNSGLITVKSDVYSFGVVLLEIACCRSNLEVNVSTSDKVLLSTWVYDCLVAGELYKLVGEEEELVDMKTPEKVMKVGLLCVQDDPNQRPSMKDVILMLEGTVDIPVPAFPNRSSPFIT